MFVLLFLLKSCFASSDKISIKDLNFHSEATASQEQLREAKNRAKGAVIDNPNIQQFMVCDSTTNSIYFFFKNKRCYDTDTSTQYVIDSLKNLTWYYGDKEVPHIRNLKIFLFSGKKFDDNMTNMTTLAGKKGFSIS